MGAVVGVATMVGGTIVVIIMLARAIIIKTTLKQCNGSNCCSILT
jgi:hypothetical protein